MPATLSKLLDLSTLRKLASAPSIERGMAYFANGHVHALTENAGTLTAKVHGTHLYRVRLWVADGQLDYRCSCPVGQDGEFCKHCVATALAWTTPDKTRATRIAKKTSRSATVTMDDVKTYLTRQDKSALVQMLVQYAKDDDELRQRLFIRAAKGSKKGLDVSAYRDAIDAALDTGDFVDYGAAYGFSDGINEVIDSIDELLREGWPAEVIDLTEYALAGVSQSIEYVDDSDGLLGEILVRLQDLHLAACAKARPDPEALAKRLLAWELQSQCDIFYGASATYATVLGAKGLAAYRQLAEKEWAKLPPLKPGSTDSYDRSRFGITQVMETLARQTGDVEALVAVKQRDLSSAYSYLQIAEAYRDARKYESALAWAERGMTAFKERPDSRLRDFLANEYHRIKRRDDAMALVWAAFAESPGVDRYAVLKEHADRARQWPKWRAKAIEFIRQRIEAGKKKAPAAQAGRWAWHVEMGHSELVRVFLWEKDVDAAWSEAIAGGCSNDLWMTLADKRRRTHPEDALPIYLRQIEPTVGQTNNRAYEEAIRLLLQVRELMARLNRDTEFAAYVDSLRGKHKAKRNFIKLLATIG